MKTSKLLIFGILVSSLAFAPSAFGQCDNNVSCGNKAYFATGPNAGQQTTCVKDGDELTYRVKIGLGLNDCPIVDGLIWIDTHDGRTFILADDWSQPPDSEEFLWTNDLPGWTNVIIDSSILTIMDDFRIDPNSYSEIQCTSIVTPDINVPSGANGEWELYWSEPNIKVTKTPNTDISKVGDIVIYEICVTNTSLGNPAQCDLTLYDVTVVDTLLGPLPFPPVLDYNVPVCLQFPYEVQPDDPDPLPNEVTAVGFDYRGEQVTGFDEALVDLVHPDFTFQTSCQPSKVGDLACLTLNITNTGDCNLVILDWEFNPPCEIQPVDECYVGLVLEPGESCQKDCCFEVPPGAPNPLLACVEGTIGVEGLPNTYPFFDCCEIPLVNPQIDLEKTVEPNEACPGQTVIYTICIENTGDWALDNIEVHDPLLCPIYGCPLPGFPSIMFPGEPPHCEEFPYTIPPDANVPDCGEGWFTNCAEVIATAVELGNERDANDCAQICCRIPGNEGCTPGYWKNSPGCWECADPDDSFEGLFGVDVTLRAGGKKTPPNTTPTLMEALNANGGGVNALARHAVAAFLNACDADIDYPMTQAEIIAAVQEAVASGDYETPKGEMAGYNELGCNQSSDNAANPCSPSDD